MNERILGLSNQQSMLDVCQVLCQLSAHLTTPHQDSPVSTERFDI